MKLPHVSVIAAAIAFITGNLLGYFASHGSAGRNTVEQMQSAEDASTSALAHADPASSSPEKSHSAVPSQEIITESETRSSGATRTAIADMVRLIQLEQHPIRKLRKLNKLCASLDAAGAREALDLLLQQKTTYRTKWKLVSMVMKRWAELEPKAAADYAATLRDNRVIALYAAVHTWAASDLAGAKNWVLSRKDREAHQYGINSLINVLRKQDPRAAIRLLEELPRGESKSLYVFSLFGGLARQDPAFAAELANTISSSSLREAAVGQIASAWGQTNPAAALNWLFQNAPGDPNAPWQIQNQMATIIQNWVHSTPEAAATFASEMPAGEARSDALRAVAEAWGKKDPQATAEWIQTLPKSRETWHTLDQLIMSWTSDDPQAVGRYLLTQPVGRSRTDLLDTLGRFWGPQDPQAALTWARQQQDPVFERTVAARALGTLAFRDKANAADYFSQLKSPEAQKAAISTTASELTQRDPKGTANWLMDLPESLPIGNAIEWSISIWAGNDPKGVAEWLDQQPSGSRRDSAVNRFVSEITGKDINTAAMWANSISDDQLRRRRVEGVVRTWAGKNQAAARQWVLQQRFTATEQQNLLMQIEKTGAK